MAVFSDDFNRADGAVGANWAQFLNKSNLVIASNQVTTGNGAGADSTAGRYVGGTVGGNQYCKLRYRSNTASIGLARLNVRASGTTSSNSYWLNIDAVAGQYSMGYYVGNTETIVVAAAALPATLTANDVFELRASGTTISGYQNSVLLSSFVDAQYASGNAALVIYESGGTLLADDFEVGDLGSGSRGARVRQGGIRAS